MKNILKKILNNKKIKKKVAKKTKTIKKVNKPIIFRNLAQY